MIKKQIEYLLGGILGYISFGIGLDEFRKLNAYYSMINPQGADNFKEYFEGILDISGLRE